MLGAMSSVPLPPGPVHAGSEAAPSPPDEALAPQVVPLALLRRGDPDVAAAAVEDLKRRGFCWISIEGDRLFDVAAQARAVAWSFLAGEGQGTGRPHAMEGHFSAAHKDGIRVVTGDWLKQSDPSCFPLGCREVIKRLAAALDDAQVEVAGVLAQGLPIPCQTLFGAPRPLRDLASLCDIPLLASPGWRLQRYGLLDIVRYHMGPGAPAEVVAAHTDPGLLVLSLPPSGPGLELQDENGSWVSPPNGAGVLWVGDAGNKVGLRAAPHRVLATPDGAPRLSVWHELCTRAQLAPPMLLSLERHGLELRYGHVRGTSAVLQLLQRAEDHQTKQQDVVQPASLLSEPSTAAGVVLRRSPVPDPKEVQLVKRKGVPVGKARTYWHIEFQPVRSDELWQIGSGIREHRGGQSGRVDDDDSALYEPIDVVEIVRKPGVMYRLGASLAGLFQ